MSQRAIGALVNLKIPFQSIPKSKHLLLAKYRFFSSTTSLVYMTKAKKTIPLQSVVRKAAPPNPKYLAFAFKTGPGEYAEHDKFLGVTNPQIRAIAKENKDLSFEDVKVLLQSEYNEERFLALVILTERYKKAEESVAEDIYQFYLSNMNHINNWNLVDTSAHLIIGAHLMNKNRDSLLTLVKSEVLWERRIAIVSTLQFIRSNDLDWTFRLSEMLLGDTHDLIHKASGWMLREAGKKGEARLLQFLDQHASAMPRTMLRYSIEKLTGAQRKHYMGLK